MNQTVQQVFFGYVSETSNDGTRTTYDISGFETMLQRTSNFTVQYNCPKRFGSVACGVEPDYFTCTISSQTTGTRLVLSTPLPLAVDRYQFGRVRVLAGPFAGYEMDIEEVINSTTIDIRGSVTPANFENLPCVVATGCKKTYASCLENGNDRFIGFPSVPGSVFVYSAAGSITKS